MPPGFFFRNQVASGPIRGRESVVIETPRAPGAWPAAGFTDTELGWSDGTGGCRCREGSSAASSSLKP